MSMANFWSAPSLVIKNAAKSMRDVGMMSGGKINVAPEEMIQPSPLGSPPPLPKQEPGGQTAAPVMADQPQLPSAAIPPAAPQQPTMDDIDRQLAAMYNQMTPANKRWADSIRPDPAKAEAAVRQRLEADAQSVGLSIPPGMSTAEADRILSAMRRPAAGSVPAATAPNPTAPATHPAVTPAALPASALPPAAQAAKQAWEAQYPGLTAPWEVVSRQVLAAEDEAAAAAEKERIAKQQAAADARVPAAQAALDADRASITPERRAKEEAERQAIIAAAKQRNMANFKAGVGYGTANPNGVTDEHREAYWRGQAAKGDKYAIGQVNAIDARRGAALREKEINAPVEVAREAGTWQEKVAKHGADAVINKAIIDADAAYEIAVNTGDVTKFVAAQKAQTDLLVGLAGAAAKDGGFSEDDRSSLKAFTTQLSSLQIELNGLRPPDYTMYPNGREDKDYIDALNIYKTRMSTLKAELDTYRNGVKGLLAKLNPAGVGGGKDNPAPVGERARSSDGRWAVKTENGWVFEDTKEPINTGKPAK